MEISSPMVYGESENKRVGDFTEHLEQFATPGRSVALCTNKFRMFCPLVNALHDQKLKLWLMLQYFRCLSCLYFNDNSISEQNLGRALSWKMIELWESAMDSLNETDADEWCDICSWFRTTFSNVD